MIRHPQYKPARTYFDIALIKLATEVTFSKFIRPACLWQSSVNTTKSVAIGFGSTGYFQQNSEVLLKVGLDVIDNQECSKYFDSSDKSFNEGLVGAQVISSNNFKSCVDLNLIFLFSYALEFYPVEKIHVKVCI